MKLAILLSTNNAETNWNAIKEQVEKFLQSENAQIIACGTCMAIRKQGSTEKCPEGSIEDWYRLVAESDKVLTF